MFKKIIYFILIILLITVSNGGAEELKYTNPIGDITDIGDPYIISADGKYYLYATSMPTLGFKVWQSDDLINWEEKGLAFDSSHHDNRWGNGDFWAPEVIEYKDKFYMTYSARDSDGHLKIAVAAADNPLGPWEKADENPILEKNLEKGISGPGHNSFVYSKGNNELYIVYHTHTYPNFPSGNRNVNIDRAYFENGKLKIDGPSREEKPYPN